MHLKHATGDTILVRELSPERISAGGIIIPETAQDEYARYGVIEAVGPRVEDPELVAGLTVVFSRFHAKTKVDGRELNIVSEEDVYAVVDEAPLDPPIPTSKVRKAIIDNMHVSLNGYPDTVDVADLVGDLGIDLESK